MRGKKRPQADRTRALGIAAVEGFPAAAKITGIPQSTIYQWAESPEFEELRKRTKDQAAEEWWAIVQHGMRRVRDLLDSAEDVQKTATATAIVADKMLLIRGEATSRSETRTLGDLDDHERAAIKRLAIERLAGFEVAGGTEGAGLDAAAASAGAEAAVEPVAADGGTGQRQD